VLKELFDFIGQQAVKAAVPTQLRPDSEPRHVYYLRSEDGALERHEADPEARQHRVLDIASLARFGVEHASRFPEASSLVLWYSRAGLTLILDDTTRRDRVFMPLEFSPQMLLLQSLEKSQQWYSQAAFISLLRIKLAGSLGMHQSLIPSLRKIKFRTSAEGGSEVVQAKASIGKSISAELSGAEPLPDEVTLSFYPFSQGYETVDVVCSLDVKPEEQQFSLTPLAGQIEDAIRAGERRVRELIAQEMEIVSFGCPVYYGAP
jgi:hypothetical protein